MSTQTLKACILLASTLGNTHAWTSLQNINILDLPTGLRGCPDGMELLLLIVDGGVDAEWELAYDVVASELSWLITSSGSSKEGMLGQTCG